MSDSNTERLGAFSQLLCESDTMTDGEKKQNTKTTQVNCSSSFQKTLCHLHPQQSNQGNGKLLEHK